MMRVLLDTNVLLDLLLQRDPWAAEAEAIRLADTEGDLAIHVSASSLTDVFYVSRRLAGRDRAWGAIRLCLDQFRVVAVGGAELQAASGFAGEDFEDNLQIAVAVAAGLECIVTRDLSGFGHSPVPALQPADLLAKLATR